MKVLLISVLVKNQHAEHMQKDLNNSLMKERSLVNSLKETLAKEKSRMTELGVALEKERVQALSLKWVFLAMHMSDYYEEWMSYHIVCAI